MTKNITTIYLKTETLEQAKRHYTNLSEKVEELILKDLGQTEDLGILKENYNNLFKQLTYLEEKIIDLEQTEKSYNKQKGIDEQQIIKQKEEEKKQRIKMYSDTLLKLTEYQELQKLVREKPELINDTQFLMEKVEFFRNKIPKLSIGIMQLRELLNQ